MGPGCLHPLGITAAPDEPKPAEQVDRASSRADRARRTQAWKLGLLIYACGAFLLGRALLRRYAGARIWLLLLPLLLMGTGAVAGLYLPQLVPDRPTPALSVVYYGLYLLAAILVLLGLPFFVAAALPLPRASARSRSSSS